MIILEFTWQGLASFLRTFFVQYHGYAQTLASTHFAAYFAFRGVFQFGVRWLSDRFGTDAVTAGRTLTGWAV